jgi:hypothetical protein
MPDGHEADRRGEAGPEVLRQGSLPQGSLPQGSLPQGNLLGVTYGEHLLVWTLRRLVARRGACPLILREFSEACGEDAEEVLSILRIFLGLLGYAARRRVAFGPPGWPGLTGDERRLLSLMAAAQAEDGPLFEAHLSWLARREARRPLGLAARGLAAAFAEHRLWMAAVVSAVGRSAGPARLGLVP